MQRLKTTTRSRAIVFAVSLGIACGIGAGQPRPSKERTRQDELARAGYLSAVPLGQAVEEFNRRAAGDSVGRLQPPLTAEEVAAAIRAWDKTEARLPGAVFQAFQKIARTGTMPKGSYIRFIPGVIAVNGFDIDVWWVDLQIALDKYPTDLADVPMYMRRIRTTYVSSRPNR
ncbi:MAG: hypothetical protein M3Z23_03795 [Acidobacteriota bacterium]|nr:hypothetical protein [Acidobacteriota bacterium]